MTKIRSLTVQYLRSHQKRTIELSRDVTIITGDNGSGKTTLLEAIATALQGTSFKGSDKEQLQHGKEWWRVDATIDDEQTRSVTYRTRGDQKRKQVTIDGVTTARMPQKHRLPVVIFEPEDLRMLHGSPTRRRDFIDQFISNLDPTYGPHLRKYERAVKQRNTLLKKGINNDAELFAWEVSLAEHGAVIIAKRWHYCQELNSQLQEQYNSIAHTKDAVDISYSYTPKTNITQQLLQDLQVARPRDMVVGTTSVGPHRHDVVVRFNDTLVSQVASRGEARTIVLALKFIEVISIEKLTGQSPIILLDDVFSELDVHRQKALSSRTKGHQIIMTSTHVVNYDGTFTHIEL